MQKSERGTLRLKINAILTGIYESKKVKDIEVLPLNTYIYSYRNFPPVSMFPLLKKLELCFDHNLITTHYVIVAEIT